MMKNYDESVKMFSYKLSPNYPYISKHLFRILIIGSSVSDRTNVLLNLVKHQRPDTEKIY